MKNDLAVDSGNLKALKSFGFGWLIRKDLDRKNFKPFLNHLPLSFLFILVHIAINGFRIAIPKLGNYPA